MIKINGVFVEMHHFMQLIEECRIIVEEQQKPWKIQYLWLVHKWLSRKLHVYNFGSLDELVDSIFMQVDKNLEVKGSAIAPHKLSEAKGLRRLHRLGRLFEPYQNQIGERVPGIHQVPPQQLLPLDHHWNTAGAEQRHRWQRTSSGRYVQLKPKGELPASETIVSAFGQPDNPSMLYWRDGRQLGHRYQATRAIQRRDNKTPGPKYSVNNSPEKKRTYGGKKNSITGAYKIKGMSDGHAIQARDDQLNLDPHQAPSIPSADRHPHNMYWEHQKFGKSVRQDHFEQYAFDEETWLLQVNEYTNYGNPISLPTHDGRVGRPAAAIAADRVHLLAGRPTENPQIGYWRFNNRREANYNNLAHRVVHGDYAEVPNINWQSPPDEFSPRKAKLGSVPHLAHLNVTEQHAHVNRVADVTRFPHAQVLTQATLSLDAQTQFRETKRSVAHYESPPITPHYLSPRDEEVRDVDSVHFEGQEVVSAAGATSFVRRVDHQPGGARITVLNLRNNALWRKRQEQKEEKEGKGTTVEKSVLPKVVEEKAHSAPLSSISVLIPDSEIIDDPLSPTMPDAFKTPERKSAVSSPPQAMPSISTPLDLSSLPHSRPSQSSSDLEFYRIRNTLLDGFDELLLQSSKYQALSGSLQQWSQGLESVETYQGIALWFEGLKSTIKEESEEVIELQTWFRAELAAARKDAKAAIEGKRPAVTAPVTEEDGALSAALASLSLPAGPRAPKPSVAGETNPGGKKTAKEKSFGGVSFAFMSSSATSSASAASPVLSLEDWGSYDDSLTDADWGSGDDDTGENVFGLF